MPEEKKDDRISLRDAALRQQIDEIVAASNGDITLSAIVRTAIEEKLAKLKGGKVLVKRVVLTEVKSPAKSPAAKSKVHVFLPEAMRKGSSMSSDSASGMSLH